MEHAPIVRRLSGVIPDSVSEQDYREYLEQKYSGVEVAPSVIYAHGFASSPGGAKAEFFRDRLAERGILLRVPDLNVPDFEHLTLTAAIGRLAEEIAACPPGPVYLIGSSLGAAISLHCLDRSLSAPGGAIGSRVAKVVFLAPALNLALLWLHRLGGKGLAHWQSEGMLPVYHYGFAEERPLHFGFFEDLGHYNSDAVQISVPVLAFHGLHDEAIDCHQSVRWAEGRPNVDLRLIEGDHGLIGQLEEIWPAIAGFLEV